MGIAARPAAPCMGSGSECPRRGDLIGPGWLDRADRSSPTTRPAEPSDPAPRLNHAQPRSIPPPIVKRTTHTMTHQTMTSRSTTPLRHPATYPILWVHPPDTDGTAARPGDGRHGQHEDGSRSVGRSALGQRVQGARTTPTGQRAGFPLLTADTGASRRRVEAHASVNTPDNGNGRTAGQQSNGRHPGPVREKSPGQSTSGTRFVNVDHDQPTG
jgi:hypothetical protein